MIKSHIPRPLFLNEEQKQLLNSILQRAKNNDLSAAEDYLTHFSLSGPCPDYKPNVPDIWPEDLLQEVIKELQTPGFLWPAFPELFSEEKLWAVEKLYAELRKGTTRSEYQVISEVISIIGSKPLPRESLADNLCAKHLAQWVVARKPIYHPWEWVYMDTQSLFKFTLEKIADSDGTTAVEIAKKALFDAVRPVCTKS